MLGHRLEFDLHYEHELYKPFSPKNIIKNLYKLSNNPKTPPPYLEGKTIFNELLSIKKYINTKILIFDCWIVAHQQLSFSLLFYDEFFNPMLFNLVFLSQFKT